jgi:uncharacterized protein YndB with AHSA1/START domain
MSKERLMNDFTATFVVDESPKKVFDAINNVRGWWGDDVQDNHAKVGDEFTYRLRDIHYSKLRVAEFIPDAKVTWLVLDNHMNFVQDQSEWVGTTIRFEIARKGDQTEVRFAHWGLVPEFECYDVCSNAWGSLVRSSVPQLIATGTGQPYS